MSEFTPEEQAAMEKMKGERVEGFDPTGSSDYEERKDREPSQMLPVYRVNNRNPFLTGAEAEEQEKNFKPGIKMTVAEGFGENMRKSTEITDKVQAVILYTSMGRKLETGKGKSFRTVCQSHDGHHPSVRIDEPLCRQATTNDLVRIMSKWKNMDQAKIDAKITELTDQDGKLQVCGLKTQTGVIELCPFARKNEVTGKKGDCVPHIYVQAYDLKRERQFKMELTGKSTWQSQQFIAPFHEFFKFLRASKLMCFGFVVDLSPATDGKSSYLNLTNWRPIASDDNRKKMMDMAIEAKDKYEKAASRLSKEAYAKMKSLKEEEKQANASATSTTSEATKEPPPKVADKAPQASAVSFEEDDIPF